MFKSIQEDCNDIKSLVMPFDIRWSSLYNTASLIIEAYPALVQTLERIADDENDATALGYYLKLTEIDTLTHILIFNDLLLLSIKQISVSAGCLFFLPVLARIGQFSKNLIFQ